METVRGKLNWVNRYSGRLVKLSDKVFVLRNDMSKEKEEYWNDEEYIKLTNYANRISCKIDVLARYGNIMSKNIFDKLKV